MAPRFIINEKNDEINYTSTPINILQYIENDIRNLNLGLRIISGNSSAYSYSHLTSLLNEMSKGITKGN